MKNIIVGKYNTIKKAIIDKILIFLILNIEINKEDDIKRGYYVFEGGVTIVAKNNILVANNEHIEDEYEKNKKDFF